MGVSGPVILQGQLAEALGNCLLGMEGPVQSLLPTPGANIYLACSGLKGAQMEHFPSNVFFFGKHLCSGCEAIGLGSTLQNNTRENQLSAPSWCLLDSKAASPVCWYYCSGYLVQTQILKGINKEGKFKKSPQHTTSTPNPPSPPLPTTDYESK